MPPASDNIMELLFRLKADTTDLDKLPAKAQDSLSKFRSVFQTQIQQLQGKGLELLDVKITQITDRVPLVGKALGDITGKIIELGQKAPEIQKLSESINKVAQASGRSASDVTTFLKAISGVKDEGQKASGILSFLGNNLAATLLPTLNVASKASKTFADGILSAAKAAGKSDEDIAKFSDELGVAKTRTEALSKIVGFLGTETAKKLTPAMDEAAAAVAKIARTANLPLGAVHNFIGEFSKLGTVAEKNAAAVGFFGEAVATKVGPELAAAEAALAGATGEALLFTESLTAVVSAIGPVGVAIVGLIIQLTLMAAAFAAVVFVSKKVIDSFIELAKGAAQFRGELLDLSQQTGVTVETLSALEIVAKTTGSSIQGMVASILFFQRKIEEAKQPTSQTAAIFRELGVTSTDTSEALKQTLSGLFAIGEGSRQTSLALQLFGRSSRAILAILKESQGDLDAVIKKAKEFGILISTEEAQAADKFNDSLEILNLQLRALFGKEAIGGATQAIQALSNELNRSQKQIQEAGKAVKVLADAFGIILVGAIRAARGFLDAWLLLLGPLLRGIQLITDALSPYIQKTSEAADSTKKLSDEQSRAADENRKAVEARLNYGQKELDFLKSLQGVQQLSVEQQLKLGRSYDSLEPEIRAVIERYGDEQEALKALIEIKEKKLAQDREEAKQDPNDQRVRQLREQIAQEKELEASRSVATDAALQAVKLEQERAKRAFQEGTIRLDQQVIADKKAAEETLRIKLEGIDKARKAGLLEHQEILSRTKERLDAGKKVATDEETAVLARLRKLDQDELSAKNARNEELERIDHDFRIDTEDAEKKHQENLANIFQQRVQNRISAIRDELATGDSARKALLEAELQNIEVEKGRNRLEAVESALERKDIDIQVLRQLNAQRTELIKNQVRLEDELTKQRVELLLNAATKAAIAAEDEITKNQESAFNKRKAILVKERDSRADPQQRQEFQDQITALEEQHNETVRQGNVRRQAIYDEEARARAAILTSNGQNIVRLVEQAEQSITNTIRRQAELRFITEETAAKRIGQIRLNTLKVQADLIRAEITAAALIRDPRERALRENELNNALKQLLQTRLEIITDTNESVDKAREDDLENERRYQRELSRLQGRAFSAQRDAIKSIISLLSGDARRRQELIRTQIELEHNEEDERHRAIKENTQEEISIRAERIRLLSQQIKTMVELGEEDQEKFQKLVEERRRELDALASLNDIQEAEETRHAAETNNIAKRMAESGAFTNKQILGQLELDRAAEEIRHKNVIKNLERRKQELIAKEILNDAELEELKRINKAIEEENARHKAVIEGQKQTETKAKTPSIAQGILEGLGESSIKKQGDALKELGKMGVDAFKSMAQALGQLVQQWVLYGNTGPGALRKVVAATLAAFSSQAAVAALMELAYGFAALTPWGALLYGPAPLHFKAAALFAAAAAISGLAGRAIAGNSFSQGAGGAGAGASPNTTQPQQPPRPIDLSRQSGETIIRVFVHAEPGPGFNQAVVNGIVRDVQLNGPSRQIIVETVGG